MSTFEPPIGPSELPAPGEWPCQTEPSLVVTSTAPRLVAALYVLLRDYVAPGDMEQVLINVRTMPVVEYTNHHLQALAEAHATYLLDK